MTQAAVRAAGYVEDHSESDDDDRPPKPAAPAPAPKIEAPELLPVSLHPAADFARRHTRGPAVTDAVCPASAAQPHDSSWACMRGRAGIHKPRSRGGLAGFRSAAREWQPS